MSNEYAGRLIIEWPPAPITMGAIGVRLIDADSGLDIPWIVKLAINAEPDDPIMAVLTANLMFGGVDAPGGERATIEEKWVVVECRVRGS